MIHDAPHVGILFGSWDSRFEYNEIFNYCLVSDDMGAFYSYDLFDRMGGHSFAYNFIHNSSIGDGIYFDHDHRDINIYGNLVVLNSAPKRRGTAFLYKIGSQVKNPQTIFAIIIWPLIATMVLSLLLRVPIISAIMFQ